MGQSWSIIVFAYNESGNVEQVLTAINDFCQANFKSVNYEVIVVDDGSSDGSEHFMKQFTSQHSHFILIRKNTNKGIGEALISGYRSARYENICAVPADGQFDVSELKQCRNFKTENYISFYRPVKDGYTFYRNFLSNFNSWVNRWILGLDLVDVNWIKVYKKKQLDSIDFRLKSSLIESEICSKLNLLGYTATQLPSEYLSRDHGRSKGGSIKTVSKAMVELVILIFEIFKFRIKN